ncbi:MAG: GtrA family protein [Terriglobales bacterium]
MSSAIGLKPEQMSRAVSTAPARSRRRFASLVPAEAVKYAVVGFSGIGVNLLVMAAILQRTAVRDWRASLVASVVSTMSNYVWNNFWTFRSRAHSGMTFVRRYVVYFAVSLIGLAITTIAYAWLSNALGDTLARREVADVLPVSALLLCQLAAILAGTLCNYLLNLTFTWPHPERG